jgi:uncharacterized protein (DUF1330 family)
MSPSPPKPDIEPVATLVERLRKAADHSGMILTDPPQPTALNALLSEAASALLALEGERDASLERVDELEAQGESVSTDFEKDCWVAMRSLLNVCHFDWRDVDPGEGVTADDAREYIATTINEVEAAGERYLARAEAAEAEVARLREALTEVVAAFDDMTEADGKLFDKTWLLTAVTAARALSSSEHI